MTHMRIFIDDGDTPKIVANRLRESGRAVESLNEVFKLILYDAMVNTETQIRSEGRRGGGSYKRLAPMTIDRKGDSQILYTSGARTGYTSIGGDALVRSVTQPGARFQVANYSKDGFTLGSKRPYARVHQYGHTTSKATIPARPFLRYIQSDIDKWNGWISAHLLKAFEPMGTGE